jgi:16S rRNA (cytidine1402-2'-O)-methyltransferase
LLTLVPTPIGNLQDISFRAIEALKEAQVIMCEDTRVTKKLLNLLSQNYNIEFNQKDFLSFHHHNGDKFLKDVNIEFFDKNIVYVTDAGMPCVSDPGSTLVEYCINHNIEYDVLPGSNALLTAYAMSGFDYKEFSFFGFLPHKGEDRRKELEKVINSNTLSIVYESPHRIEKLLQELNELIPERMIFIAKEITKAYQTSYKDSAKNIYNNLANINTKGEWVVIVDKSNSVVNSSAITIEDIKSLDISLKQKSKLIAKITGLKPKECYNQLLEEEI